MRKTWIAASVLALTMAAAGMARAEIVLTFDELDGSVNETVDNFYDAIIRLGRCLGNLFFGPLPADEADAWRT